MRAQPGRDLAFWRKLPAVADKLEQLPASTIFVAVGLVPKAEAIKRGIKKHSNPNQAKRILKKPSAKYKIVSTHK